MAGKMDKKLACSDKKVKGGGIWRENGRTERLKFALISNFSSKSWVYGLTRRRLTAIIFMINAHIVKYRKRDQCQEEFQ